MSGTGKEQGRKERSFWDGIPNYIKKGRGGQKEKIVIGRNSQFHNAEDVQGKIKKRERMVLQKKNGA